MKTAHECWLELAKLTDLHLLPTDSIQYVESRRMFYAGMYQMLMLSHDAADESPGEAEAVERIESIHQELQAFFARLKAGQV